MNKVLRIKCEGTMGYTDITSPRTIDILKDESGDFHCRYKYKNYNEDITIKSQLDANIMNDFMGELSTLTIPAFPQHNMGLDGGFTEIEMGNYDGKSYYRWWTVPPKGWGELDDFTQRLISFCDFEEKEDT